MTAHETTANHGPAAADAARAAPDTARTVPDSSGVVLAERARYELLRELAEAAAGDAPIVDVFDLVVERLASILDHELCKVLQLLPSGHDVKLVSGVGWQAGLVGSATVGTGQESQAGYTLRSSEPVVVEDLRTERRFWGPPLLRDHDVVSGMSAIIPGADGPWGVLGVHSTRRHQYTDADPAFVATVAASLGAAITVRALREDTHLARDRAGLALRHEETRSAELRAIIGAMGDGVVVFDELDRLLLMNQAAQRLLAGQDVRALRDLASLVDLPMDAGDEHVLVERPIAGGTRWLELSMYGVPSAERPAAGTRVGHENRASRIVVLRDVTEARSAREAREVFVGMLSHELKTPITTVYAGAELIAAQPDHPRRAEIAGDVRAEADRLRRMIDNLLVLSRVERNVLELVREPVSLGPLVPTIVAAERTQWPAHPITLSVGGALPTVAGDQVYVEQILRNLVGNAAKFSPTEQPIDVTVAARDAGVAITVRDRGRGFAADETERLFDLFYRSPSALRIPGSGIGLFVSRKLAELMGGRLVARPKPDGGAEFELTLPRYTEA